MLELDLHGEVIPPEIAADVRSALNPHGKDGSRAAVLAREGRGPGACDADGRGGLLRRQRELTPPVRMPSTNRARVSSANGICGPSSPATAPTTTLGGRIGRWDFSRHAQIIPARTLTTGRSDPDYPRRLINEYAKLLRCLLDGEIGLHRSGLPSLACMPSALEVQLRNR